MVMTRGIEELIGIGVPKAEERASSTYIAVNCKKGARVMLTEAFTVSFENPPAKVELNNLTFDAHKMFLAHYSPMWIDLGGDARVTYVIPDYVISERIGTGEVAGINVTPSHIYVAPVGSEPLEAVLTSERKDAVMDVLRGDKSMLYTKSPQLVIIDGRQYVNIDEVPMTLGGPAVITPRNPAREHTKPLTLALTPETEISYK